MHPFANSSEPLTTSCYMGHYTATRWLVHWPLMGGLLHLVQRGGDWAGPYLALQVPPRCTKCSSPPIYGQCTIATSYKKLSYSREAVRCLVLLSIFVSDRDNEVFYRWFGENEVWKEIYLITSIQQQQHQQTRFTAISRGQLDHPPTPCWSCL